MLGVPVRTILQEYVTVRSLTFLGLGGNGNFGMDDLGVSAAGGNDICGIVPQFMSMAIDGMVGYIYKIPLLPLHS